MTRGLALVACLAALTGAPARGSAQTPDTVVSSHGSLAMRRHGQPGRGPVMQRIVSLNLRDVPLETALDEIDRQAGIDMQYTPRVVPVNRRVTVHLDSVPVAAALAAVLSGTNVRPVVTPEGGIMLVSDDPPPADTGFGTLAGRISDSSSGTWLDRAVVTLADSTGSAAAAPTTVTSDSGYYFFWHVPAGPHFLKVRRLGYRPGQRRVRVLPDSAVRADLGLSPMPTNLDALVVTATGLQRRFDVPNDVTVINADSIVKTEPVWTVTQLLENRVPGLEVYHTSGTPGDPARLRLRGSSSFYGSNDPIVFVDGVRVFAAQSDSQSANLVRTGIFSAPLTALSATGGQVGAPSALDQIDPNTIASIEVFKGPSAAAMYGPDAANGVIVITTKHGQAGGAAWNVSATRGTTFLPGQYPLGLYPFGQNQSQVRVLCLLGDYTCRADSVVKYQALNDPAYTILGHGNATRFSAGVQGSTGALSYSIDGSTDQETGFTRLPSVQAQQYQAAMGAPVPGWMQRPDHLSRWSGNAGLTAHLDPRTDVSLSFGLTQETQQRSSLDDQLTPLMSTYVDKDSLSYWRGTDAYTFGPVSTLVPNFFVRATDDATNVRSSANLTWRPRTWLNVAVEAGVNSVSRHDQQYFPRLPSALFSGTLNSGDSTGDLGDAHGSTLVTSLNLLTNLSPIPLPLGFKLNVAVGANYAETSNSDLSVEAQNLLPNTSSLDGAGRILNPVQTANDQTTFGYFLAPTFSHRLVSITTGFRLDGGSSFRATPPAPKLGVRYLVSGESWFPFKRLFEMLSVRASYGVSGVAPRPDQRLRLFQQYQPWVDGQYQYATAVTSLGNTDIRPERRMEWEGGFDADLLHDVLSATVSFYDHRTHDAIVAEPVAPSVYGEGGGPYGNLFFWQNLGEVRNTGLNVALVAQLVGSPVVHWSETLSLTQNHNEVVSLGRGVQSFYVSNAQRVAAGYPIDGYWARPITGYYDANHDGIIDSTEVRLGDSAVYMGSPEPKYSASLFTNLSLFSNAVTLSAGFSYEHARTQLNEGFGTFTEQFFLPGFADPSAPLSTQAAAAVSRQTVYGMLETVSTLRFDSFSLAYNFPPWLAQHLGARYGSVMLQGTNLGLWTNYRGKDPNVNAFVTGNAVADTGILPQPRTWQVSVRLSY